MKMTENVLESDRVQQKAVNSQRGSSSVVGVVLKVATCFVTAEAKEGDKNVPDETVTR